jgi:hypothetical protein
LCCARRKDLWDKAGQQGEQIPAKGTDQGFDSLVSAHVAPGAERTADPVPS